MAKRENFSLQLPKRIPPKAQERYLENLEKEKEISSLLDSFGHINGQGRAPVGKMHFGSAMASGTACEIIAVYNVLKDLGKDVKLSDLIFQCEAYGFLLLSGFFGTKIGKIGSMLDLYQVPYGRMPVKEFIECGRSNRISDGQIFIVTIKTRGEAILSSLHTFELVYYKKKWVAFNRFNNVSEPKVYKDLGTLLKNGRKIGSYFYIYKINADGKRKESSIESLLPPVCKQA